MTVEQRDAWMDALSKDVAERIEDTLRSNQMEIRRLMQEEKDLDKAWSKWDWKALAKMGFVSRRDLDKVEDFLGEYSWDAPRGSRHYAGARKMLIRKAASLPKGSKERRAILASLQGKTARSDVLEMILPMPGVLKLQRELERSGDEQSSKLIYEIWSKLQDALDLSRGEQEALSRLRTCVDKASQWDPALLRNNIFKAANSLGIRLPSAMFASTHTASKPDRDDLEDAAVIEDSRGGYDLSFTGKFIRTFGDFDDALKAANREMKRQKYWPDIYYINDHGNVDLLDARGKSLRSWV